MFINPPKPLLREYDRLEVDFKAHQKDWKELIDLPAVTRGGVKIKLAATILDLGTVREIKGCIANPPHY